MSDKPRERCNGPGRKTIFETKAEALAALRIPREGKVARVGNGKVVSCNWAAGAHWHITSGKTRKNFR